MKTTIDYVREQLERRASERQLELVATGSGVSLRTLHNIRKGGMPQLRILNALDTYLKDNVRRRRLDEVGDE